MKKKNSEKKNKKRRIQSSHLALRFYKHDLWTEELVNELLDKGKCTLREDELDKKFNTGYYGLYQGCLINKERVLEAASEIVRYPFYHGDETDEEYLDHYR